MKYLICFLVISLLPHAYAKKINPAQVKAPVTGTLKCQNKIEVMITGGSGPNKTFYKKDFSLPLKDVQLMTLKDINTSVAVVFPQWGIDYKVRNKNYTIHSDKKSYFNLSKDIQTLLTCEVGHD